MIFITGPLYSGKRTFARRLSGRQIADAQDLAAGAENLERLAGGRGRRPVVWPACWPRARTR